MQKTLQIQYTICMVLLGIHFPWQIGFYLFVSTKLYFFIFFYMLSSLFQLQTCFPPLAHLDGFTDAVRRTFAMSSSFNYFLPHHSDWLQLYLSCRRNSSCSEPVSAKLLHQPNVKKPIEKQTHSKL